jgi:hypothetical protein
MGLRPLALENWIEFGDDAAVQLAEKSRLLATSRNDVYVDSPDLSDATHELLAEILSNLTEFHPEASRTVAPEESPLVAASLLVPEDLCVMVRSDDEWRLGAACVCFPSRWRLADKAGASLDEIHGPVPRYGDDLAKPTHRFFDRLDERAYWRLNWTLLDDAALFQPARRRDDVGEDPESWQFRVERQTLRRLPESGVVVFTIRTYVAPARDLARRVDGFSDDVALTLRTTPPEVLAYKGWERLSEIWERWYPA